MKQIFQKVTQQLIDQLTEIEKGERPAQWFKPWTASGMPTRPTNQLTGAPYKGINSFMLYMTALSEGYRTNQWVTFKQKDIYNEQHNTELKLIKGCHGSPIFKYVEWVPRDYKASGDGSCYINTKTGEVKKPEEARAIALRSYTVFNLDQMENLPDGLIPDNNEPINWAQRYVEAQQFVLGLPCEVRHGTIDKAYYMPSKHFIMMPNRSQFKDPADYYGTLFHEHVHSTGPVLERDMGGSMGDERYAKEELVAEIGAAMLAARFGIAAPLQHPQYIRSYMSQLQASDRAFWDAANKAQKAVNHLTGEE